MAELTGKPISDLTSVTSFADDDLFLLSHLVTSGGNTSRKTRNVRWDKLKELANDRIEIKSTTNANSYTTQGVYYFGENYIPSNVPYQTAGWLVVMRGNNYMAQMWVRASGRAYLRGRTGSSDNDWGAWAEFITDRENGPFYSLSQTVSNLSGNVSDISSSLANVGGYTTAKEDTGIPVNPEKWTRLLSFTVNPGKYVVQFSVFWPKPANGGVADRKLKVLDTDVIDQETSTTRHTTDSMVVSGNVSAVQNFTYVLNNDGEEAKTYYLNGWQNSDVSVDAKSRADILRIK